jgi:hypothetical protein
MALCRALRFKPAPVAVREDFERSKVLKTVLQNVAGGNLELRHQRRAEPLTLWLSSTIVRAMNGFTLICGICREIIR